MGKRVVSDSNADKSDVKDVYISNLVNRRIEEAISSQYSKGWIDRNRKLTNIQNVGATTSTSTDYAVQYLSSFAISLC